MLNAYLTDVETLLHDFNLQFYGSPLSLTTLINRSRQRIAAQSQCVRVLIPKNGPASSATVTAAGTGYTSPTVSGGGGSGATWSVTLSGTTIQSINLTNGGGTGYQQGNSLTITDANGTGGSATVNVATSAFTTASQEVYTFSSLNSLAQNTSGVNQIQGIFSVAVNQGTTTPVMRRKTWTDLQGQYRAYNTGYTSYPEIMAQYGQGVNGSFYLWPIPSQIYGMDIDCYCLPVNLTSDSTPEAIPYPWTDSVQYYAAAWALRNAQRHGDAEILMKEFNRIQVENRAYSEPPYIPSVYADYGDDI